MQTWPDLVNSSISPIPPTPSLTRNPKFRSRWRWVDSTEPVQWLGEVRKLKRLIYRLPLTDFPNKFTFWFKTPFFVGGITSWKQWWVNSRLYTVIEDIIFTSLTRSHSLSPTISKSLIVYNLNSKFTFTHFFVRTSNPIASPNLSSASLTFRYRIRGLSQSQSNSPFSQKRLH